MTLASNLSINFGQIQSLKKFPMAYYDNIKCFIYGCHCKIRYIYLDILLQLDGYTISQEFEVICQILFSTHPMILGENVTFYDLA